MGSAPDAPIPTAGRWGIQVGPGARRRDQPQDGQGCPCRGLCRGRRVRLDSARSDVEQVQVN